MLKKLGLALLLTSGIFVSNALGSLESKVDTFNYRIEGEASILLGIKHIKKHAYFRAIYKDGKLDQAELYTPEIVLPRGRADSTKYSFEVVNDSIHYNETKYRSFACPRDTTFNINDMDKIALALLADLMRVKSEQDLIEIKEKYPTAFYNIDKMYVAMKFTEGKMRVRKEIETEDSFVPETLAYVDISSKAIPLVNKVSLFARLGGKGLEFREGFAQYPLLFSARVMIYEE